MEFCFFVQTFKNKFNAVLYNIERIDSLSYYYEYIMHMFHHHMRKCMKRNQR
jgi:hypothetical protein